MTKYIYALYASLIVTLLVVVVASAHNIIVGQNSDDGRSLESASTRSSTPRLSVSRSALPSLSVVPRLNSDYTSVDTLMGEHTTSCPVTRAQRRALRAETFALSIDSIVATRSFAFYPTTMQASPRGELRSIYAQFYYLFVGQTDVEVHLPIEYGISQYVSMLNFDTSSIEEYHSTKHLSQWVVTFSAATPHDTYYFNLLISTITGETELLLQSSQLAMRYTGSLGSRMKIRHIEE